MTSIVYHTQNGIARQGTVLCLRSNTLRGSILDPLFSHFLSADLYHDRVVIDSRTLATYSYTEDQNKYLDTLAYGN